METVKSIGFHENFIEALAETILAKTGGKTDLSRICVVFGGKRPQLFLRKALGKRLGRPFLPPQCFSMEDFVNLMAGRRQPFTKADELQSCFLLYKLAKEKLPELLQNRESFSRFLAWSREILNFIEQLDLQDIPEGPLKEIEVSAAIGYEVPESVNILLRHINLLRKDFHAALSSGGALTRGMAYRTAAAAASKDDFPEFDLIIFCNFYFLHATEQKIITDLHRRGKAMLFFQRDTADWPVLEKLEKDLGIIIPKRTAPLQEQPGIKIYSAFDMHSQVCCVREILKATPQDEQTVIVLPDADALIPLLSEIAGSAAELNVSLGYPVKRSSLYSLFNLIFEAQGSRKTGGYYSRDYLKAISHPLVKNLSLGTTTDPAITRVLVHKVEEMLTGIIDSELSGKLFVEPGEVEQSADLFTLCGQTLRNMELSATEDELKAILTRLHRLLFGSWESVAGFESFCGSAEALLAVIIDQSPIESYPLNLLVCEKILAMLALLRDGGFDTEKFGREEIFRVFMNDLESRSLSFTGSPLKGLQILGLFETRCLDFENVIVLDLNEKTLPNLSIYEPLIPREIMLGLGLNRIEKEDEIQRYQFFRLIGGSRRAHLIYITGDQKEKSRFLEEIIWERQKKEGILETAVPRVAFTVEMRPGVKKGKKTPEMIEFLKKKLYSASSVNTYLHCPLRFYFQYVLGLKEKTDLLEETEAADVGTFVHDLLEEAFTPFIGTKPVIDEQFQSRFFSLFEERFTRAFERKMRSDSFMLKEILCLRLRNFLSRESQRQVAQIVCLEQEQRQAIELDAGRFSFTYRIDRVDRLEDRGLLVLDYKTGGTDLKPAPYRKIIAQGMERTALKKSLKSFQMPMYLYFINTRFPKEQINAGLYSLRSASISSLLKEEELGEKDAVIEVFLACLQSLFTEILDPAVDFCADSESAQYCSICPFACACR